LKNGLRKRGWPLWKNPGNGPLFCLLSAAFGQMAEGCLVVAHGPICSPTIYSSLPRIPRQQCPVCRPLPPCHSWDDRVAQQGLANGSLQLQNNWYSLLHPAGAKFTSLFMVLGPRQIPKYICTAALFLASPALRKGAPRTGSGSSTVLVNRRTLNLRVVHPNRCVLPKDNNTTLPEKCPFATATGNSQLPLFALGLATRVTPHAGPRNDWRAQAAKQNARNPFPAS
jgi:hypothetical protein